MPHVTPMFEESLVALARRAMQDTGAAGFAWFRRRHETGDYVSVRTWGATISGGELSDPEAPVASRLLRFRGMIDGVLAFTFPTRRLAEAARPRLDRLAAAIEQAWAVEWVAELYRGQIRRIIARETARETGGVAAPPGGLRFLLEQILDDLEAETEARKSAVQAWEALEGPWHDGSMKRIFISPVKKG